MSNSHLFLVTLLGGQVFPLRHSLGDVDDCLDGFVECRLDAVEARLNDDLRDDEHDVGDEERRGLVGPTGNSRACVT